MKLSKPASHVIAIMALPLVALHGSVAFGQNEGDVPHVTVDFD